MKIVHFLIHSLTGWIYFLKLLQETICLSFAVIYFRRNAHVTGEDEHTAKKKVLPTDINCKITLTLTSVRVITEVLGRTDGAEKSSSYVNRDPDTNNNKSMRPIRVLRRLNIFSS